MCRCDLAVSPSVGSPRVVLIFYCTEALRRSAELTLRALVRIVFSRLHSLDPEVEEEKLVNAQEPAPSQIDMSMTPAASSADVTSTVTGSAPEEPPAEVAASVELVNQDQGIVSIADKEVPKMECRNLCHTIVFTLLTCSQTVSLL